MRVPLNPSDRIFIAFPNTAHYSPICYFPESLGILTGRLLSLHPLTMLYLGREFNLLFWIIVGYWSIRTAPSIAHPLLLILLMPMSLYVAATLSADAPTNAMAAALSAMVCGMIGRKEDLVTPGRWLLLLILSIAVCLCKTVYAPLVASANVHRPDRLA
jgi:uncharacterized membrane protein